jgi:hypothetical protein
VLGPAPNDTSALDLLGRQERFDRRRIGETEIPEMNHDILCRRLKKAREGAM